MDARPDAVSPAEATGPSLIEPAELRSVLSNLSHELCRPLLSLRAGFDLLLGDACPTISHDQRGHVRMMVGLCDDLLRMTRNYLDYAGLVQGTRPLCLGSFGIGALVREIDREFAALAASRNLGWECTLEGPDAAANTDATRCQQIFGSLVSNALKYTPRGGDVRVTARVEGARWVVTVADDGPGIPADETERVFQPFYRLPNREDHCPAEGNGLGLAICREMVGQLGGEVSLVSAPGQGTRVTVTLPLDATEGKPRRANA